MNILGIPDPDFALLIVLIEVLLVLGLLTGWYFGARRLNLNLHHLMVYVAVTMQVLIVSVWMVPRILEFSQFILADIPGNIPIIIHAIIGTVTVINGVFIAILFLIRRDIPLKLLKRVKPVMIAELIIWSTTLVVGTGLFVLFYL